MHQPPMSSARKLFAAFALFEAITWAGLLVGMVLKYGTGTTELGVWLFGRLHGVAFLAYLSVSIVTAWRLRWPWWGTLLAILAAIPPLVTLPLELWFRRRGMLAAVEPQGWSGAQPPRDVFATPPPKAVE